MFYLKHLTINKMFCKICGSIAYVKVDYNYKFCDQCYGFCNRFINKSLYKIEYNLETLLIINYIEKEVTHSGYCSDHDDVEEKIKYKKIYYYLPYYMEERNIHNFCSYIIYNKSNSIYRGWCGCGKTLEFISCYTKYNKRNYNLYKYEFIYTCK